jgi:hypothetical protein
MDARVGSPEDLAFRPDGFFLGYTSGAGVIRDPLGRITRRFTVETQGHREKSYNALHLEETFAFDDGGVETFHWVISHAGPERYVLAEARAGSGIIAQAVNGELRFAYNRASGPARGIVTPRFAVRMTLLDGDTVLKAVKITVLGAPMGMLSGLHRRSDCGESGSLTLADARATKRI